MSYYIFVYICKDRRMLLKQQFHQIYLVLSFDTESSGIRARIDSGWSVILFTINDSTKTPGQCTRGRHPVFAPGHDVSAHGYQFLGAMGQPVIPCYLLLMPVQTMVCWVKNQLKLAKPCNLMLISGLPENFSTCGMKSPAVKAKVRPRISSFP